MLIVRTRPAYAGNEESVTAPTVLANA